MSNPDREIEDMKELQNIMDEQVRVSNRPLKGTNARTDPQQLDMTIQEETENLWGELIQWTSGDGKIFFPASDSTKELMPGFYQINIAPSRGLYFEHIPASINNILRFPDTACDEIINHIESFWNREDHFKRYKMPFKRGILMWGPAGSGKTCVAKLVMKDVIDRGGIVIKFFEPDLFMTGFRILREIQPDTPVVVLMEDLDSLVATFDESEIINILDGVQVMNKVVYVATTNYPQDLGDRIVNRPSRFDKVIKISNPNAESRKMYFEYLCQHEEKQLLNIDKWVQDTKDLTIAHLGELFKSVIIFEEDYDTALLRLQKMRERASSEDDDPKMGFAEVGFG